MGLFSKHGADVPGDREGADAEGAAEPGIESLLATATENIELLVAAAEDAASRIRASASSHLRTAPGAPRIDREQLVAELADSLAERAEALSVEARDLAAILERSRASLLGDDKRHAAPPPHLPASAVPATPRTSPNFKRADEIHPVTPSSRPFVVKQSARASRETDRAGDTHGVRLLATQMAVAGSSGSEIEDRLRDEFGIVDPVPIINDVLDKLRSESD